MDSGASYFERLTRVAMNHRLETKGLESLKQNERIEKIRGMLNYAVYASAENWMKPSWVVLHPPEKGETELRNDTHRNHVVFGKPGGNNFARCDSSGLLTTIPECGSIDFWLYNGEETIFPALTYEKSSKFSLISPEDQIYEWSASIGAIDFSRLLYHAESENIESIINEIHVNNRSLESVNFTFYIALRPMSSLGVEPIESIVYDEKTGRLYANEYLALILHKKPTAVYLSTADDPNIISLIVSDQKRTDQKYSTIRGLATAVVRYDLELGPAESQLLYISNPLEHLTQADRFDFSPNSKHRTKTVQSWFKFSRDTMGIELPDNTLQTAYTQAKATLAIQTFSELKTIPKHGEGAFWREQVRILFALLKIGCYDIVKQVITEYIENNQRAETQYEFSVISPLVWMSTHYIDYSKDNEFLKKQSNFLNQWFDIVFASLQNLFKDTKSEDPESEISTDNDNPKKETIVESELKPEPDSESKEEIPELETSEESKLSSDIEPVTDEDVVSPDFEYSEKPETQEDRIINLRKSWTSEELLRLIWNYETIRKVSMIVGKKAESEISDVLAKCETLILEQLEGLSFEPLEALDILSTISLLNIVHSFREQTDHLVMKLDNTILKDGLIVISTMKKLFSSHHALRVGQYYCLTNQRYMVEEPLLKSIEFLSEFHLLPEYVNLKTKGGSAGDGCSTIAAADLILLLCDLLIYEVGEDLVLLSGIPEEWYSSTRPTIASAIRTKHGKVSLDIGTSANQHQIEVNMTSLPQEIEIHVPHSFSMQMIKVFGAGIANRNSSAASPNIRVVPLSESVVLTAHK